MTAASGTNAASGKNITFDLYGGKFHDLTIRCQGREWKVHRILVCTVSRFFEGACEHNFQEGISRVIDLKEDEPSNVEKMLQFIYTGDYSDLSSDDPDTPILASAMVNVEIYAIAEKYDIRTLKELAKKKFESSVDFSNANMSDVSIIIEFVYRTTPSSDRGLRDIIAPYLTSLKTELRASDDFMDLIKNKLDGDFAIDVIEAWVSSKASQGSTYGRDPTAGPCCPVCKGVLLFCKSRYRYVAWTWSAGEPCCSCGVKHIDTFCANCPGNRTLLDRIALIYGRGM